MDDFAKRISQSVQMACVWEASAPKPGNVNRYHDFPDSTLYDFLKSAIAIGPVFENSVQQGIGQIIWSAAAETRRWVHSNTNLGLILLLAPLAKACADASELESHAIRQSLNTVLKATTVEDARLAYAAIRLAQPGGMGKVAEADIAEEPAITLLQAMTLAQERDSVAREYVSGFAITFEIGFPSLLSIKAQAADYSCALVQTYLTILSRVPDSLIARKNGNESAYEVSQWASEVLDEGGIFTAEGRAGLKELDCRLRDPDHMLNPGTTADLTAAAAFLDLILSDNQGR
jgi:triphosphoribosyl-dephospho-CoA synthase